MWNDMNHFCCYGLSVDMGPSFQMAPQVASTCRVPQLDSQALWLGQTLSVWPGGVRDLNLNQNSYHCWRLGSQFTSSFPEGITLDILAQEFWVPGSSVRADAPQYQGKDQFQQILKADENTCVLWALRATQEIWYMIFCLITNHLVKKKFRWICHNIVPGA